MASWLEVAMRTNRKVRPIRPLTEEDIQLFLEIERARMREARRLDVGKQASGIVLITVMLASIFAFFTGAATQWILGKVLGK